MPSSKRIVVMISSRCTDRIITEGGEWRTFSELRKAVKEAIESTTLFDVATFECWVHEHEPPLSGETDFWEQCLEHVRECDILLVLSNGNAGFANEAGDIGICHAELMEALRTAPGKVRVIEVSDGAHQPGEPDAPKSPAQAKRDADFQKYLNQQMQRGKRFVEHFEQAVEMFGTTLQDAVVHMVRQGGREVRKGKYYEGEALDWSRDNFANRKRKMETVLRNFLAPNVTEEEPCVFSVDGERILFECHAVPAAMSTAAAREMVGRPFLRDHEHAGTLRDESASGPVHLIACHKGVTETQAVNLLGFPDATVVTPPFGVYVADPVQNIQLVFLANCRDESSTRYGVQRFRDWLTSTEEARYLARRAPASHSNR